MRKFTILIALVAFASFAMAQALQVPKTNFDFKVDKNKSTEVKKVNNPSQAKDYVWMQDFEGPVSWTTFEDPAGEQYRWHIYNNEAYGAAYEAGYNRVYTINDLYYDEDDDSNHYAIIDVISGLPQLGGPGQPTILDSYIQFDDIDLTGVMHPSISWLQVYRALNTSYVTLSLEVSPDDGETWTSIEVNQGVVGNQYGDFDYSIYIGNYVANSPEVSIRFRWQHNNTANVQLGYAWSIDDIVIFDTPAYDALLYNAAMNFFIYIDYTVEGGDYYHYSSHFGQIPVAQMQSDNAFMVFNFVVDNKGSEPIVPVANVKITNPYGEVIFNKDFVHTSTIAPGERDTVDCLDPEFYVENPYIGEYNVEYTVSVQGQTDGNADNDHYSTKFYITNDVFARDLDNINPDGGQTMNAWVAGGVDEEMLGAAYWLNKSTVIESVDVFFTTRTTPDNAFKINLLYHDGSAWATIAESDLIMFDESNIGVWSTVQFSDNTSIDFDEADAPFMLVAAAQYFYLNTSEDSDIYIGIDASTNYSDWCSFVSILSSGNWEQGIGWINRAPAIRLNVPYVENSPIANNSNVNIYPNPSNGTINIENVEGANVVIMNTMGQVVRNINNAQVSNAIDMSSFANGTYFVKVINGNDITTHKVNLMK